METLLISLGIVFATGLSAVGAAFGIGQVGSAIAGAITEKPEIFSKGLIGVVLAEAVAIYGLLISFIALPKLGVEVTLGEAGRILAAGLVIGFCGLGAGVGIGYAGAAMVTAAAEKPETLSKTIIAVVLAEAMAIYGLLIAFILLAGV